MKVHTELHALREHIQEKNVIVAEMAAGQEQNGAPPTGGPVEEDPTVFESQARGRDDVPYGHL